jgi:hypothetical protein
MRDIIKFFSLCLKAFIKTDKWIFFGASLTLGLPFIEYFSMVFDLPFNTGNFDLRQVFVLGFMWFFLVIVAEMVNYKINKKYNFNVSNLFWGLLGFGVALFLMR